jgi:hypothetical protein
MKIVIKISLLVFLFLMAVSSCKKKKAEDSKTSYTPSCNSSTPSFSATAKPLFLSACVNCHSEYGTYTQISASASSIRSNIVSGAMPKGSTLSEAQKNSIVCWIDAGKPNN